MLKARILRLEATRRPAPRPFWALITRETADPFAARDALLERTKASPLTDHEAAELLRLQRVIENYEMDMAV